MLIQLVSQLRLRMTLNGLTVSAHYATLSLQLSGWNHVMEYDVYKLVVPAQFHKYVFCVFPSNFHTVIKVCSSYWS